jgi:DNA-binding CsgD family transcriptional regulator
MNSHFSTVSETPAYRPPRVTKGSDVLSRKELACLTWCKEGKTNWEIGEILVISEKTVEFHLRNATRKLGATNRITAVVAGIKTGLIAL